MEKLGVLGGLGVFIASWGITLWGKNGPSLLVAVFVVGGGALIIFAGISYGYRATWCRIHFDEWNPRSSSAVVGGVKVTNKKDEFLEDCEFVVLAYEDLLIAEQHPGLDHQIHEIFEMEEGTHFPTGLYWWVDNKKHEKAIPIGPDKSAYLAIVYYEDNPGVEILGEKNPDYMKYKMETKTTKSLGIFANKTKLHLQMSAFIKGEPLPPKKVDVIVNIRGNKIIDKVIEVK